MNKIIYIFLFAMPLVVEAQNSKPGKLNYQPSLHGGILVGASGGAGQFQLVNGLEYRKYFAGVGVGVDNYYRRTVPLFLELRRELNLKGYTPYIYAQGGHDFVWLRESQANEFSERNHESGLYYDFGIGYRMPLTKKLNMTFSAGYSYKEISLEVSNPWMSIWPPPENAFRKYDYQFRRISVRVGIGF